MNAEGFEPSTACLEGRCSIQLSYASIYFKTYGKVFVGVAGFEPAASCSQSRRDNRATLHPEGKFLSGETGTRTLATVTRRQISNLLHYRSGTSPSSRKHVLFCGCKCNTTLYYSQLFLRFFLSFFNLFFKTVHNQTNRINKKFILN